MGPRDSIERKIVALARRLGVLRVRDLKEHGIHPEYIRRLCATGLLQRWGRGLYKLTAAEVTENYHLAQVFRWIPSGVVCLVSALRFHEIGTQAPQAVWLALERGTARPRLKIPQLRVFFLSGPVFFAGVEIHRIDGVDVRVYNAAKTVADCFKFRNKIGIDVAIEALRECLRGKKATRDDLWRYAATCRVTNVMRPYLEALS
jgi:predicted transcriptional regulator of viral defense system